MVDNDEFQLLRKKTVAFTEPEYPPLTYSRVKRDTATSTNVYDYDLEEMDDGSLVASGGSGGIHADFAGDDYIINPLQDADDDDSLDPFGDDESLFLDTGEEILRRGTTIKKRHSTRRGRRNGTLKRVRVETLNMVEKMKNLSTMTMEMKKMVMVMMMTMISSQN